MTNARSTAPDFTLDGITWQCWIVEGGSYEWRSTCGQFAVWREGKTFRARRGDQVGTVEHEKLINAMWAAQKHKGAKAA